MRSTQALVLLAFALAVGACDDPTPLVVDSGPSPVADATAESGFDLAACEACLMAPDKPGPGCQNEIVACEANAQCASLQACSKAMHCLGQTATGYLNCDLPCTGDGGLAIGSGPGYTAAAGVFMCVTGACSHACLAP
jgi:hypothetical protein